VSVLTAQRVRRQRECRQHSDSQGDLLTPEPTFTSVNDFRALLIA